MNGNGIKQILKHQLIIYMEYIVVQWKNILKKKERRRSGKGKRVNDMFLAFGYIRYIYKYSGYRNQIEWLGAEVINIVIDYMIEKEWIHVVDCISGGHWRLGVIELFKGSKGIYFKPPPVKKLRKRN